MSKKDKPLTFEQALSRLEKIVEDIEQGKIGLAESIDRFEEGTGLIRHCQSILSQAELKIRQLQASPDDQPAISSLPASGEGEGGPEPGESSGDES